MFQDTMGLPASGLNPEFGNDRLTFPACKRSAGIWPKQAACSMKS